MESSRFAAVRFFLILMMCVSFFMTSCYSYEELNYYADKNNYISATGIVDHIAYTDDFAELYLAFSDLNPSFDDTNFKIVGENLAIAKNNGIDEKIHLGDQVTFISAPMYLGDGYVIPIVSIIVDGDVLLSFEDGFDNLQEWLKQ